MKQRFSKRTRLVSALLTLAMVFTFLPFSAFAAGGTHAGSTIELSSSNFPDDAFREYLKTTVDKNGDRRLIPAERNAVKKIDVHGGYNGQKIKDLTGIEFFPNLEILWCYDNQLTELDVSKNKELRDLDCDNNQLTSLQLDDCPNLGLYSCNGNEYSVQVYESTRILDPGTLPGNFDISRVRNMNGATKNADGTMTVNPGEGKVLYEYRLFRDYYDYYYVIFTLNVEFIPDGIRIYGENFPSYEFRQYLKANIDKNKNGYLDDTELNISTLDVSGQHIANLKGIEYFTNLETLYCYNNKLTSLDVSKNPELKELQCYNNKLTSLNVSENTVLETLYCFNNQLMELDVSKNTALKELGCAENKLTSLDVSKNTALQWLSCYKNNLTSLDVTQNTALKELSCYDNQLTSLDVSKTAVTTLDASGNKIDINVEKTPRTFDLSKLPRFEVSKADNWVGGTVSGNTLTVDKNATQVTYTYDCGKGRNTTFTLNVNVVPDGTVTPPSGGGSTGGGSTGGGSTGGGSTGGSTGGGSPGGGTTIPPEAGKYQLTVTDGVATVNGKTGDVLNVEPGATVTLTADTTKFPESEEFGWWEITPYGSVSNTLTGQYQRTATFTMPNENVSARAMSKSAGVSTGGDDGGGGGGAAILLVGGAAVAGLVGYGVYSYVSEQQLKALLPEGVAMPENRAQTALLLWNTAGRPEPAEAPAFKDVADPDTAKAAQWCVEHGLMDQKLGGRFAPDNSDPAYKTLNAYQQLVG